MRLYRIILVLARGDNLKYCVELTQYLHSVKLLLLIVVLFLLLASQPGNTLTCQQLCFLLVAAVYIRLSYERISI